MALQSTPTTLLTLSLSTKEMPRADSNVALELAAAYHRDFQECIDDEQIQQICRAYRDRILGVSRMADVLAAAFKETFPQSSQRPGRGDDGVAWTEFASLALRQHKSRDREAQKLQHQTCIVALWGGQVFKHYHWRELPLDYIRLLHDVARRLPAWDDAVDMINSVMLERHERRVVEHHNRSPLIGEHARGSKIQDHRSPVQRQDVNLIIERLNNKSTPVHQHKCREERANRICSTPIKNYGLEHDSFSMIVPCSAPGVIRQTESPSSRTRKRRELTDQSFDDQSDAVDASTTPTPQQPTPISAAATDSEMTEFEDGSYKGTSDEDTDQGSERSEDDRSDRSMNGAECATSGTSADFTSSHSQHSQESRSSRSCFSQLRPREVIRPDFSRQSRCNSEDLADVTDTASTQSNESSGAVGNAIDSASHAVLATTPSLPSVGTTNMAMRNGCTPKTIEEVGWGSNALFQGPSDDVWRGQRQCASMTDDQEEPFPATSAESPSEVILTSKDRLTTDGCAETTPVSEHSDELLERSEHDLVTDIASDEGNDIQEYPFEFETDQRDTEVETDDESSRPEAEPLQEATNNNSSPAPIALLQGTANLDLHSLPTQLGRFIPAAKENFMSTPCVATIADDDQSVVGRMANCYSS